MVRMSLPSCRLSNFPAGDIPYGETPMTVPDIALPLPSGLRLSQRLPRAVVDRHGDVEVEEVDASRILLLEPVHDNSHLTVENLSCAD